jgi:hypothetical protein
MTVGLSKVNNSDKIILDLCGGTGAWSKPYKDAGYDVRLVTLPEHDVTDLDLRKMVAPNEVYGILAAPPCTMFSFARTNAIKPRDLQEGMETVRACLNIIWECQYVIAHKTAKITTLKFWALENPVGMLRHFLGNPPFQFTPYEFGDDYQKRTHLWGCFNKPKKTPVEPSKLTKALAYTNSQPLPKFDTMKSKDIHPEQFGKLTRQERRAITPAGFANAFFKANR